MKRPFLSVLASLLLGAGWASAQTLLPQSVSPGNVSDVSYPPGAVVQGMPHQTMGHSEEIGSHTPGMYEMNGPGPIPYSGEGAILDGCTDCAPGNTFWGGAEYVLWNIRNDSLPRVMTSVPIPVVIPSLPVNVAVQNPLGQSGVIPGTTLPTIIPLMVVTDPTIPNAGSLNLGDHPGGRVTFGTWLNDDHSFGIEASGFVLTQQDVSFSSSQGLITNNFNLSTALPVFNVGGFVNSSSILVTIPGRSTSTITGNYRTNMWGAEANAVFGHLKIGNVTFSGRTGFRYLQLRDVLSSQNNVVISTLQTTVPGNAGTTGTAVIPATTQTFTTQDELNVRNRFYGANLGGDVHFSWHSWFLHVRGQVALGAIDQRATILGQTLTTGAGAGVSNAVNAGGLLSGPNNQGTLGRTRVAVLPEVIVKVGYDVTDWLRLFAHYDAFAIQKTVRPGTIVALDGASVAVNVTDASTSSAGAPLTIQQPTIVFSEIDTWVRGIGFGAEIRY